MKHAMLRELKALLKDCNGNLKKYAHLSNTKAYEQMYATANDLAQKVAALEWELKHA